jgi:hypothetical protein
MPSTDQGIPDNAPMATENVTNTTDSEWQMVDITAIIDPEDTEASQSRSKPVRERKPTNFFNISGLRGKSYD